MKITLHHTFFFSVVLCVAVAGDAWAQDAGMSDVEIVDQRNILDTETMLFSPGEGEVRYIPKASNPTTTVTDSIATAIVTKIPIETRKTEEIPPKPTEKTPAKEADDSILTFNFLYYIIQKYKLQDIID